jgi:hypothetical protein
MADQRVKIEALYGNDFYSGFPWRITNSVFPIVARSIGTTDKPLSTDTRCIIAIRKLFYFSGTSSSFKEIKEKNQRTIAKKCTGEL